MSPLPLRGPLLDPLARVVLGPVRRRFRARVSGSSSGVPDWVRDVATVGTGPGWFEPDGVVWQVHGDLATLVGGVAALLGQATHPLALAGVQQHSSYRDDPWHRLAGTARWLAITTFGSAELAEAEAARVRGIHVQVRGTVMLEGAGAGAGAGAGQAYAASDPDLLRWVHLAFTDAFLASSRHLGPDLTGRFGPRWDDTYVADWARSAVALGALDLPATAAELEEAVAAERPRLAPVPADLRAFLAAPPGLGVAERAFYTGLTRAAGAVLHPTLAPLAGVPGRGGGRPGQRRAALAAGRLQIAVLRAAVGRSGPAQDAARYRLGAAPAPAWLPR